MQEITEEEVSNAYLKLKSHFYYDANDLFQRRQIAIFETCLANSDIFDLPNYLTPYRTISISNMFGYSYRPIPIEERLNVIAQQINNFNTDRTFFNHFFKRIELKFLPKKIEPVEEKIEESNIYTNRRTFNQYAINRVNAFFEIPVELHIVTVLWIQKFGYLLDKSLGKNCYGNRLLLNKDKDAIISGSGLFVPYANQYQKWRNNAIEEAKQRLDINENVIFINLDLKDYYYSVRVDFQKIEREIGINDRDNLHSIFKEICKICTKKIATNEFPDKSIEDIDRVNETILPIGLLSSPILANWYLKEFDNDIIQKSRPIYYGRYVDDILLLFKEPQNVISDYFKNKNPNSTLTDKILTFFLTDLIGKNEKLDLKLNKKVVENYFLKKMKNCCFQQEKTLIYYFDSQESSSVIDKFVIEIEKRSSEFQKASNDAQFFDDHAFHINYDNSEEKFKTLKDYKESTFGLSNYFSHQIFRCLNQNKRSDNNDEILKILKFFRGKNALDNYRLWEKILTFFVISDNKSSFISFYKIAYNEIKKIKHGRMQNTKVQTSDIEKDLIDYLHLAMEMSLALNFGFINKKDKEYLDLEYFKKREEAENSEINVPQNDSFIINRFRDSNMIRHHYVSHSLLNFYKLKNK